MSRTLAEMTPEERAECQWMQATVMDEEDVMTGVIQRVHPHGIWVMFKSGRRNDYRPEEVVPRPDLPRMVWPDADHPEFLQTEEDYRSAPEGTIVAEDDSTPIVLIDELWRNAGHWGLDHHDEMAGIRRRVLRWGWEA